MFRSLETGHFSAVISLVSVAEIICGPLRKGLNEAAFCARDYLLNFPNAECTPVDEDVIAAVDRFLSNDLRWRDALAGELLLTFDAPS